MALNRRRMRTVQACFVAGLAALALAATGVSTVSPKRFDCVAQRGATPVVAGDGSLVFARTDGLSLLSARSDGARVSTLYRATSIALNPAVSPDGRLIAFDLGNEGQVWLMNRDGSNAHFVANGMSPSFSPDGKQLAIGGPETSLFRNELDLINLDGSGRHAIAVDASRGPHPSWSPDGRSIAFVTFTRYQMDFPAISRVDSDGGRETRLVAFGDTPSWSPDGNWIAYNENADRSMPTELHVIRPDGSDDRAVASIAGLDTLSPAWSPVSGNLVFSTYPAGLEGATPDTFGGDLWTATATGRAVHPLAPDCRFGTAGRDKLHGGPRADTIYALEGNDTIDVRGGGRDTIDCGPGRDIAYVDRVDRVARGCERVLRPQAKRRG
jgi:hypothetical protein